MAKNTNTSPSGRHILGELDIDPSHRFRIEEAYKSIRTNIMFSVIKKGCKRIVVSSPSPSEGKTTTVINLAISIAQADQRVLLIDADLRKPKIHHSFKVSNTPGLTNYIGDSVKSSGKKIDLFSIIHPTEFDNLSILCSGSIPPNPAEMLGSEPMIEFLDEVEKDYDYIIIDTPPLNVVSDAIPLICESDGVVLIVRLNRSTHPEIQRTIESLEFVGAKVLGFVINFVEADRKKYGYKYGYGKYSYRRYSRYNYYGYGYGYGNNF